jgi:hypothetical protein
VTVNWLTHTLALNCLSARLHTSTCSLLGPWPCTLFGEHQTHPDLFTCAMAWTWPFTCATHLEIPSPLWWGWRWSLWQVMWLSRINVFLVGVSSHEGGTGLVTDSCCHQGRLLLPWLVHKPHLPFLCLPWVEALTRSQAEASTKLLDLASSTGSQSKPSFLINYPISGTLSQQDA